MDDVLTNTQRRREKLQAISIYFYRCANLRQNLCAKTAFDSPKGK